MQRRDFLRMLVGGVAAAAAVRTFPFRVYSFPPEIAIVQDNFNIMLDPSDPRWDIYWVTPGTLARLEDQTLFRVEQCHTGRFTDRESAIAAAYAQEVYQAVKRRLRFEKTQLEAI